MVPMFSSPPYLTPKQERPSRCIFTRRIVWTIEMSKASPIFNHRGCGSKWIKPVRFAIIAILVALQASSWSRAFFTSPALCEMSDDPKKFDRCLKTAGSDDSEAVAVCLKANGIEPIFHRLPKNTRAEDSWKMALFARLDRIRFGCGKLCQLNTLEALVAYTEPNPKGTLPLIRVPDVSCSKLLDMEDIDAGMDGNISVAKAFPDELLDFYSVGGNVELLDSWLRSDVYLGGEALTSVWTKESIESATAELVEGVLFGTYGSPSTNYVRDMLVGFNLTNKSVLVIGSEKPWVEVICLYAGAKHVTTLEYGKIISHHPQISTLTPSEFRDKYKTLNPGLFFDGVISHSSLEHSGLGRYGDAFNPWGDILAVARAWCVTKNDPSSFMFLGLPTGKDVIFSNWHRIYGKVRWPLIAANWRHVDHTDTSELEIPEVEGGSNGIGATHGLGGGLMYHFEKVIP
jgi:Caenorhabditis protein of unknown function, DUF268